jgi:hypothetical protein
VFLYHGSNHIVCKPEIIVQNRTLDFGYGFYTTENEGQALVFSQKVTKRRGGISTVNVYSPDESIFKECTLLLFDSPDENWLNFVCKNRDGSYVGKEYDVIKGPVANDDVYRTVTLYMTGILTKKDTLSSLKVKKLYNQVIFTTEKALSFLHFEKSYKVSDTEEAQNE